MLLLTACTHVQNSTSALSVAEELVEAFNRHDPEAMAMQVATDFELYYVDEAGASALAITGRDQLVTEMNGYFESQPSVKSTVLASIDGPVYVSFREQIVGGQSSLAVYEIRDQLIQRVWYYPAE
ncbi:MAG: nuclear transport factor 2 family protein [Rhodothermaceae bacterium]|nr:nuclear transport factor 2 family protein [Rhodothermaceae bacterium]